LARADGGEGLRLERVRRVGPLLDEWAALADRVGAPPALHPGYVRAWVDAFSSPRRLRALAVRRDGELAAVLPVVMARTGLMTRPQSEVEEVGLVSDDPRAAAAVMGAALELPVAWLLLRPVPDGAPTHRALTAAAARAGCPLAARTVETQAYIDLTGGWEQYWKTRGSKLRSDISRRRRRLGELGEVTVEGHEAGALDAALDDALRIEASGWKGRSGTAMAASPAHERFYRSMARWAEGRGWLRLWFLRLDGRPIAFRLGIEAFGVFSSLKIGYLEEFAAQSPGKVLEAAVIESLHASDCRRFEYAGHTSDHKTRWATGSRDLLELSAFPATLRGATGPALAGLRARAIPIVKGMRARLQALRPRA
jgi:CelD/BcsL family acetyltransferase involved in cellulose biosynthesis